ncbi:DUF2177 domain-containing protein [Roseovarius sp. TE539]|uniref:DUF2177 family protein n=1 Tax=Roseovarius sp. TE539 TaxID=2249812 RepID=UPI000DDD6484|nr:DUF2177 family protein [Roseovarius sp. TE539]RBI73092.1 DUF2177 domain-containing protein [Roseovarius sp. TE539]
MQLALLYFSTALIFLGLDTIVLKHLMRPLFEAHIGTLLADRLRPLPAVVFYLFYVAGILWFVSWPSLRQDAPSQALVGGAFLGALAYGTYEFTNFATLRGWHWHMVVADVAWGSVLTAVSAWAGVSIVRSIG